MRTATFLFLLLPCIAFTQNRVGINTHTPLSTLDILASGENAELLRFSTERPWIFKQTLTGPFTRLALQATTSAKGFEILSANGLYRSAYFHTDNNAQYNRAYLVPEGGRVGISVPDAFGKVHIHENSLLGYPHIRLTEDGDDFARIKMENTANPGAYWDVAGHADTIAGNARFNIFFNDGIDAGDRLTVLGSGRVGIGTTSPATRLHVAGDFRVNDLSGAGDRNVIVDASGKFKIGTIGVGDNDWNETATQVISQKEVYVDVPSSATSSVTINGKQSNGNNFSALAIYNNTFFPGGTYNRLLLDANDIDALRGAGSTPMNETLNLQRQSGGDIHMVQGGGDIGIGISAGSSKVTISGPDNNGSVAGLEIRSSGTQKMLIDGNEIDAASNLHFNANTGHPVSINTLQIASGYALTVKGKVIAEEMRVQLQADWPDYVFSDDYHLMPLAEMEAAIREKGHLPGIPSATEVEANGLDLGNMQTRMMEKIEELTLHLIEVNKRVIALEKENISLKAQTTSH